MFKKCFAVFMLAFFVSMTLMAEKGNESSEIKKNLNSSPIEDINIESETTTMCYAQLLGGGWPGVGISHRINKLDSTIQLDFNGFFPPFMFLDASISSVSFYDKKQISNWSPGRYYMGIGGGVACFVSTPSLTSGDHQSESLFGPTFFGPEAVIFIGYEGNMVFTGFDLAVAVLPSFEMPIMPIPKLKFGFYF